MTIRPVIPGLYALLALFASCMLVFGVTSCGPSQRQKTLYTSLVAVNAARDGFTTWDIQHQRDIIAKATSREEKDANIGAYREKQGKIVLGLLAVYNAIALAGTSTDEASLKSAVEQAKDLISAITKLRGGP